MHLSIVGTGYVGLVTGACLADAGHQVTCVDVDREKIATIAHGIVPIHERGLEQLLAKNLGRTLHVTEDLVHAISGSSLTFIAVGTPLKDTEIDLQAVKNVSRDIGRCLRRKESYHVVAVKSTVVPGTTDDVIVPILQEQSGKTAGSDFGVGVNPEFLTEGQAVQDFLSPDRLVLGSTDARALAVMEEVYRSFPAVPVVKTNNRTAEMIKYASNCLLATLISFSNEIANLGAAVGGIDVVDVMQGLHLSRYLSAVQPDGGRWVAPLSSFLMAGCGFGGSCLPKDVAALTAHGKRAGLTMPLLDAVLAVNREQPRQVLRLLRKHFPSLRGIRVAILGLAFKPETDDPRESPAIPIIQELQAAQAEIKAYDPAAMERARAILPAEVRLCDDLAAALQDVDAVVLVTRWEEFRAVPALLAGMDPPPVLIDGRRMLDKATIGRYEGIGL